MEEFAVGDVMHELLIIVTEMVLPFANAVVVYVEFVAPLILDPFSFHWYLGVPPLVGDAVKVTEVPEQIVPVGDAAMLTLAVPVVVLVCVSTAQFFVVVKPVAVPDTE